MTDYIKKTRTASVTTANNTATMENIKELTDLSLCDSIISSTETKDFSDNINEHSTNEEAECRSNRVMTTLPKLIIFDKDGTLMCFSALYRSWMESLIDRLETKTGAGFREGIYKVYGFDRSNQKFKAGPGFLSEITMEQAMVNATRVACDVLGDVMGRQAMEVCWEDCDSSLTPDQLKLTCDPQPLFDCLKAKGVKMAMCTNDTRARTMVFLEKFELTSTFDIVVAHGDEGFQPKPNPECALLICEKMEVAAEDAVMVGDTRADTEMSKRAGLGCTIGVLTGVGGEVDLVQADVIVNDVGDLFVLYPSLNEE